MARFYCRRGIYSLCTTGSWILGYMIEGRQADYVRVPRADSGMHLMRDRFIDEGVLFVGDIHSTA